MKNIDSGVKVRSTGVFAGSFRAAEVTGVSIIDGIVRVSVKDSRTGQIRSLDLTKFRNHYKELASFYEVDKVYRYKMGVNGYRYEVVAVCKADKVAPFDDEHFAWAKKTNPDGFESYTTLTRAAFDAMEEV